MRGVSIWESLNKAASAPQGASQSLMRPEARESERPLFRASSVFSRERTSGFRISYVGLLARTRHIPFPWGGESLRVSFSAGVASVEEESLRGALSKDLLIALADRRLYEAKRRGRCCVVAG